MPLIRSRPFRSPHHTISHAGLVGGGNWPHPGEISLAHRGVLFLDELPEFGPRVLEVLRQPIEDKIVTISRAQGSLTFPANFLLIAAMNPCPCGYFGDPLKPCTCSSAIVTKYQKRISGPLLDRIDIHVEVPRVEYEKLSDDRLGEPSGVIRQRVQAARERQRTRFAGAGSGGRPSASTDQSITCNADMRPAEVRKYLPAGRDRPQPDARRHEPDAALRPRLPPHPQAGPHHRRSGRSRADPARTPGRGAAVQAAKSHGRVRGLLQR